PELQLLHIGIGSDMTKIRAEVEARWQQWSEIGVRLRHEWMRVDEAFAPRVIEEVHMWEWGFSADYPDPDGMIGTLVDWFRQWSPSVRSPEAEGLVERARALRSRDERLALFRQVDRQLVTEQTLALPTVYNSEHLVHRPWVEGLWASPVTIAPLSDLVVRPH